MWHSYEYSTQNNAGYRPPGDMHIFQPLRLCGSTSDLGRKLGMSLSPDLLAMPPVGKLTIKVPCQLVNGHLLVFLRPLLPCNLPEMVHANRDTQDRSQENEERQGVDPSVQPITSCGWNRHFHGNSHYPCRPLHRNGHGGTVI